MDPYAKNKENDASLPHGPFYMIVTYLSRFSFIMSHIAMKNLV